MWQGHLGQVKVTEHLIDLVPGSKPVFSQPYRAGPEAGKINKGRIVDLLGKDCIEPVISEWAYWPQIRQFHSILYRFPSVECDER